MRLSSTYYNKVVATTAAAVVVPLLSKTAITTAAAPAFGFNNFSSYFLNKFDSSMKMSTTTSNTKRSTPLVRSDSPLYPLTEKLENSWISQLSSESEENLRKSRQAGRSKDDVENKSVRPVFNGHYVLVQPTPLRDTRLLLCSNDVASNLLRLSPEQIASRDFVDLVSGNLVLGETWATPYALSIMGTKYTSNCPFGTGHGYGDGRAISIGEWEGQELQLKGAGKTPFHRGADGRAVLRSSIREFLASEAMHHLGVSTTRALSLVVSDSDYSNRPWYAPGSQLAVPDVNDPRLASYPKSERQALVNRIRLNRKEDPNIMIRESNAITCRVAPSFTRIGHLDLYSRRAQEVSQQQDDDGSSSSSKNKLYDTATIEFQELEEMVWHAAYREYRDDYDRCRTNNNDDVANVAKAMLSKSAHQIAVMVAGWIRVGFAQGNFNGDNCLVAGRTMDYGPFGWMEEYNPLFAKWTGSGNHFGFLNQPSAGYANYMVLVDALVPILVGYSSDDDSNENNNNNKNEAYREQLVEEYSQLAQRVFQETVDECFASKLGFDKTEQQAKNNEDKVDALWPELEQLMRKSRVDWTVFWRQLSVAIGSQDLGDDDDDASINLAIFNQLVGNDDEREGSSAFYESPKKEDESSSSSSSSLEEEYLKWIQSWRDTLQQAGVSPSEASQRMLRVNPKYVLREWMLVEAYNKAAQGDESEIKALYELIQRPYDEGSEEEVKRYYRRAPDEALTSGGTAFMS